MNVKKYSLKIEIILIFVGMLIFDLGYFLNHLKNEQYSDIETMIKSVDLTYPVLYFVAAILIVIYRIYRNKFKRYSK